MRFDEALLWNSLPDQIKMSSWSLNKEWFSRYAGPAISLRYSPQHGQEWNRSLIDLTTDTSMAGGLESYLQEARSEFSIHLLQLPSLDPTFEQWAQKSQFLRLLFSPVALNEILQTRRVDPKHHAFHTYDDLIEFYQTAISAPNLSSRKKLASIKGITQEWRSLLDGGGYVFGARRYSVILSRLANAVVLCVEENQVQSPRYVGRSQAARFLFDFLVRANQLAFLQCENVLLSPRDRQVTSGEE